MSDRLEKYNTQVRDKWIAKSLGISYGTLIKQTYFVATDADSKELVVTFIPATDTKLMKRCQGHDGSNVFRLKNTFE